MNLDPLPQDLDPRDAEATLTILLKVAPLFCYPREINEARELAGRRSREQVLAYLDLVINSRYHFHRPVEPGPDQRGWDLWKAVEGLTPTQICDVLRDVPIPTEGIGVVKLDPGPSEDKVRHHLQGQERFLALVLAYARARGQVDPDWSGIHAVDGSVVFKDEGGVEIVRIPLFYEEYLEFPLAHLWTDVTELEPIWRLEGAASIEYAATRKAQEAAEKAQEAAEKAQEAAEVEGALEALR